MKLGPSLFILFTLLFTHTATASALRCNNKVVNTGDSQYKFYKLCGEPAFVEKRTVYLTDSVSSKHVGDNQYHTHDGQHNAHQNHRRKPHIKKTRHSTGQKSARHQENEIRHEKEQAIEIEKWTYDFGSNRLIQQVRFVDGVAVKISSNGYGFSGQ